MALIQTVINALGSALGAVVDVLPGSPFAAYCAISLDNKILQAINWVLPISSMIAVTTAWLLALAIWYVYRIVLRWVKAAG